MSNDLGLRAFAAVTLTTACLLPLTASAQQINPSAFSTNVTINVVPFASLEFDNPNPLLYLEVPPPGSTIPSTGVGFTIVGNSSATLSAEPDSFMQIPASQYIGVAYDPYLGRATQSGENIAYDLELRFPVPGPNPGLPLTTTGGAVSPLVDVAGSGGAVGGVLHLVADPNWTADGGIPLPGLYEGEIILTLTAS